MNRTSCLLMTFRECTHCLWIAPSGWTVNHIWRVSLQFKTILTTWRCGQIQTTALRRPNIKKKKKTNVFFIESPQKCLKCEHWNFRSSRQPLHANKYYLGTFEPVSILRSSKLTNRENMERVGKRIIARPNGLVNYVGKHTAHGKSRGNGLIVQKKEKQLLSFSYPSRRVSEVLIPQSQIFCCIIEHPFQVRPWNLFWTHVSNCFARV